MVELDPSGLLEEEELQKILVSTRESLVAEAENALKAAEIARREYLEGTFVSLEKQLLSDLFVAERAKVTALAALESSKMLYKKAIVTASQMESAHATLDDAGNKLDGVQANLNTLRTLTKEKELTLLEAALASAEANLKSQERILQLEQQPVEPQHHQDVGDVGLGDERQQALAEVRLDPIGFEAPDLQTPCDPAAVPGAPIGLG